MNNNSIISLKALSKLYSSGEETNHVLKNINLDIKHGELVVIRGASGSGKTTLLNIIGGLETPSNGEAFVAGEALHKLSLDALTKFRAKKIGFVFQFHNLIPTLTVLENVLCGLEAIRPINADDLDLAAEYLQLMELDRYRNYFPTQLSGGQQQRVAIARALIKKPPILLADEPTGSLDSKSSESVIHLIKSIQHKEKSTVLVVTHNPEIFKDANEFYEMNFGNIS